MTRITTQAEAMSKPGTAQTPRYESDMSSQEIEARFEAAKRTIRRQALTDRDIWAQKPGFTLDAGATVFMEGE